MRRKARESQGKACQNRPGQNFFAPRQKERPGQAKSGKARQDKTRQGKARQEKTRQDKTRQGKARQEKTRQDKTRPGKQGKAGQRQGKARQGEASKARRGKARQDKGKERQARPGKTTAVLRELLQPSPCVRRAWRGGVPAVLVSSLSLVFVVFLTTVEVVEPRCRRLGSAACLKGPSNLARRRPCVGRMGERERERVVGDVPCCLVRCAANQGREVFPTSPKPPHWCTC